MTNDHLQKAFSEALNKEFYWINDFENPYKDYTFSPKFKANMKNICKKAEYTYFTLGNKRIRKGLIAILIALFILAASGCAILTKYIITWNETQNDKQGTLDITFDIKDPETNGEFIYKTPATPTEYNKENVTKEENFYSIEYLNPAGESIIYCQQALDESMSLSLDNEDAYFEETLINGHKGYKYFKDGVSAFSWADGVYYYDLQGTCDDSILEEMIDSLSIEIYN